MISFKIPGAAIPKARPRFRRVGENVVTYTDKKTTTYEEMVGLLARNQMKFASPVAGAVNVYIDVFIAVPGSWTKQQKQQAANQELHPIKTADVDNVAKSILDGMNKIVYEDDAQVIGLRVRKMYGAESYVHVRAEWNMS